MGVCEANRVEAVRPDEAAKPEVPEVLVEPEAAADPEGNEEMVAIEIRRRRLSQKWGVLGRANTIMSKEADIGIPQRGDQKGICFVDY